MRSRLIQWTSLILSALMASMMGPTSFAQTTDYPNKPIKVVVTFPPGGSSDAIIRIHPLVLENRPGAGDLNVQQFCCEGLNFGYYYEGSPIIAHEDEPAPAYSMGSFTPSTI
ncbi:MAG: 2,4-dichlorophenol 6-monooxygenase, partial [Pseudomonadota bacterium]